MGRYRCEGTEEMKIWVTREQRERLKELARQVSPNEPKIRFVLEVLFLVVDTQPSVWNSCVNKWRSSKAFRI